MVMFRTWINVRPELCIDVRLETCVNVRLKTCVDVRRGTCIDVAQDAEDGSAEQVLFVRTICRETS